MGGTQLSRNRALLITAGLGVIHLLVAVVVLPLVVLGYGYTFEGIDSSDELIRLGYGPLYAVVGAVIPFVLAALLSLAFAFTWTRRRWVWWVHPVGIAVSVALVLLAFPTFELSPSTNRVG